MKIRDLTNEQIKELRNRCNFDYKAWKNGHGVKHLTEEEVWQYAFSRGVSTILDMDTAKQ